MNEKTELSDEAPPNSLPDWYECQRILDNHSFRERAAQGLEGSVLDTQSTTPKPTELHRFIYEYDDADPYRSAWFLHRLELLLNETRALASSSIKEDGAPTLTEQLQQRCSEWGAYWRASDAHGVVLTKEQALELLRDALGVEVEFSIKEDGERADNQGEKL